MKYEIITILSKIKNKKIQCWIQIKTKSNNIASKWVYELWFNKKLNRLYIILYIHYLHNLSYTLVYMYIYI